MATGRHESVSSEQPSGGQGPPLPNGNGGENLHAPVSGEGAEADAGPPMRDEVAEDFSGENRYGELEALVGFDPSRAINEGMPTPVVTEDLEELKPAELTEYAFAESVCGRDDRVRVSPATAIPWRWICELIITMPNGAGFRGTGWFIGPRCVMTAGHCVYSKSNGGWARRIEVIPGMDGASRPFGSAIGTSFRSVTGWTSNADPNYDYGCIILPTPLGNVTGYFGFASLSDASLQGLMANNSGYPGDKPFGTQWFNAGRVSQVTARKIYYMLDTFGGQSGSPVWRLANGQRHAVGVHAYGGCPNSATRIVAAVFNNMLAWRAL
jgi:V8-like Glu-specific endopeptidase